MPIITEVDVFEVPEMGHAIMPESQILIDAIKQAVELRASTHPDDARGVAIYLVHRMKNQAAFEIAERLQMLKPNSLIASIHGEMREIDPRARHRWSNIRRL